ncbi:MAG: ATP-grasp fold amidoligase family protein [Nitrospira sp.]
MEQAVHTPKTEALRAKLRNTWLRDLVVQYRDIKRRVMRRSEGEAFLLRRYARIHGKPLNLTNPQTFTEKLFWRMVTWNRGDISPRFQQLADKYAVREHVARTVGEEYLIKLLWQGNDPHAIPFDRLPAEYVIKPNHSSGQVIIVKGEADREAIIRHVSDWLASDYYWQAREYQYYGMKPRIVIEEYLKSQDGSEPLDYRFWCFGGVPAVIQVDNHAHDINPFFDAHWNQLDLYYRKKATRPPIAKPRHFERMFELASRLSQDIGFARVDLYNINGRVYCGELTLTPVGGIFQLTPDHWDLKLGKKWDLTLDH